MNSFRARLILGCGLLLGIAGDLLSRVWSWGLNVVGWVALAVLCAMVTSWETPFGFDGGRIGRDRLIALAATFVAAIGLILRTAPTLVFYNTLALLTAAALAVWPTLGRSLGRFRVRDLLRAWWRTFTTTAFGAPRLALADVEWGSPSDQTSRRLRALLIGGVLAAPPVLIVAGLLSEADPVFGTFLSSWQQLGIEDMLGHMVVAGFIAWPVAGWLRGMVAVPVTGGASALAPPTKLDFFGVAPALYGMVGLLAAFLGLQARALFGGQAYVAATAGLTYAEYARRGFFELVTVTAIVLGLLLLGDWALDRQHPDAEKRYRATGWILLALLGVLMASAMQRMWVYVSFFGLSDTRLYATAGMTWLGIAAAWFGWTILRGRRARFGVGLLVVTAGWIAVLNVMNPEAVVVRVNLGRALAGHEFDAAFHLQLSDDAVPSLLAAAERLPAATCARIVEGVDGLPRYEPSESGGTLTYDRFDHVRVADWRSWTLPSARADRMLAASHETLLARHCSLF